MDEGKKNERGIYLVRVDIKSCAKTLIPAET